MNNEIKFVSPFKRLCVSVGNIPTAYMESMSYYECLTYFMKFLENQVIPAINNNSEVVKELQEYVTNYFNNLDVQEEINNKLDEMAEGGQLAEIITEYLQMRGVLGYDDLADLKASENIIEGSICKTLGNASYLDGKGEFYRVRAKIESDVIDDINIVGLTNYENLVAEKINNYYIEKNIIDIANNANSINSINNYLDNKNYGIVGISKNTENNDHYLYYSNDGENFYRVGNKLSLTEDSNALIEIDNTYYYFGNNSYYYSDDLVTWSNGIMINDNSGYENWAFYPFYDPISHKYYVFSTLQYKSGTFTNAVGDSTYYFKIIKQEFSKNNNKTLSFGTSSDVLYINNQSYIDPAICYDNINKYTLAIKNENTCQIELYTINNLYDNLSSPYATLSGAGTEAPMLIDEDGFITMYCHDYALNSTVNTGLSIDLGQTYSKVLIATPTARILSNFLYRQCCKMPEIFRHAGLMKCNKKILNIITTIGIKETPLFVTNDISIYGDIKHQVFCVTGGATYNVPNLPYVLYILGGGSNVELINFNVKKYYVNSLNLFLGATNIKFGGDTTNNNTITTNANVDGLMAICPTVPDKYIHLPYKW